MAVLLVIVDDVLRKQCFEKLQAAFFRVTALGSEDEARRYLRSFTPSVVVYHAAEDSDDTRRFLVDVSVRESGPQVPIVVLSATAEARRLAEGCGCQVLPMPVDDAHLCGEIERAAPQSRRSRI
ncbi:MAG: hypothetical protein ABI175_06305 [Polyangiales bacterium]